MVAVGEEDLICDFAQTYHVLDWRALPLKTAAVLAAGLPPDSRIMRRLTGERIGLTDALLASALDRLKLLVWQNTEDGHKGRNMPESTYEVLTGRSHSAKKVRSFRTPEDFEAARARIMEGG